MASAYPPFLNRYGVIQLILAKIQAAPIPERFSHEFLSGTLGFTRDADRPFVSLAKRMGFLDTDCKPTDLYRRFHDPAQSQAALVEANKNAFSQLYARSKEVDTLDKTSLRFLVADITGLDAAHPSARAVACTFLAIKTFALCDFTQAEIQTNPKPRKATTTARETRAKYFAMSPVLQE